MLEGTINGSPSPGSEGVRNIHLGDSPRCSSAGVGRYSKVAVPDEPKMEASRGSSKASSRGNTPSSQGSEASIKQGNGTPPRKSQRAAPRKSARKPPTLFADFPDSTQEATSTFSLIDECIYSTKSIGDSGQDGEVMSCECRTEWGKSYYRLFVSPSSRPYIAVIFHFRVFFVFGFSFRLHSTVATQMANAMPRVVTIPIA